MFSWKIVLLCALNGILLYADSIPAQVTFPEIARSNSPNRIVSGWETDEGQIPFQLSIRMVNGEGGVSSCGGTIIHPEWGLSAAHCTAQRVTFVIRAGAVNLTRPEVLFETSEYYNHPDYNNNLPSVVQPNDVALLKFGRTLVYSDRVNQVRIQPSIDMNRNYDGDRLVASGWGRTWTDSASPENMNWVYLSGVSNFDCLLAFGFSSIIVDSTICARGYNVTSQSTCQGDSGGPLTIEENGVVFQVGISSFVSSQGCHVDIPAGFARPGHYHDWYYEVTGINFDSELPETTEQPTTVDYPTDLPTTPETVPEVPSTVGLPENTEAPEVPSTVGLPETTAAPEVPSTVGLPENTEAPEVPSTVGLPEITEAPEVPSTVGLPEITEAPEVPSTVGLPETTEAPEVPSTGLPETTEAPEVPSTVGIPEITPEWTPTGAPEVPSTVGLVVESDDDQQGFLAFAHKFWFW